MSDKELENTLVAIPGRIDPGRIDPTRINHERVDNPESQILVPKSVQYCPVCSFPPEYCCYNSLYMNGCREWIVDNYEFNELEKLGLTKDELLAQWDEVFENESKKLKSALKKKPKEDKPKLVEIKVSNRGKRRFVTEIHGLGHYTDIKVACKDVKKKFACAATVVETNMKGRKSERNNKKQEQWRARELERQNRKNKKNGIPIKVVDDNVNKKKNSNKKSNVPSVSYNDQIIETQGDITNNLGEFIHNKFKVPISNIIFK